jgi:hypothetical protein
LTYDLAFLSRTPWTVILLFMLSTIAGMTGVHHCAQLLVEMGVSLTVCLWLASYCPPPNLSLPSSYDYMCELPAPGQFCLLSLESTLMDGWKAAGSQRFWVWDLEQDVGKSSRKEEGPIWSVELVSCEHFCLLNVALSHHFQETLSVLTFCWFWSILLRYYIVLPIFLGNILYCC